MTRRKDIAMHTIENLTNNPDALQRLIEEHRILMETIRHSPLLFAVFDAQDNLMVWNTLYEENYPEAFARHRDRIERRQMPYADLVRSAVGRYLSPEMAEAEIAARQRQQQSGGTVIVEREYPTVGHVHVVKYKLPSGAIAGFGVDINDMKRREAELAAARRTAEAAQERLMAAINVLPAAVAVFDPQMRLLVFNDGFRVFHAPVAEMLNPGCPLEDLLRAGIAKGLHAVSPGEEDAWLRRVIDGHKNSETFIELDLPDGSFAQIYKNRTAAGDLVFCRLDVTELKRSQKLAEKQAQDLQRVNDEMRRQALHDALTELPNRRYLDQHLCQVMAEHAAARTGAALMHMDLDRFKPINDTIGHSAGDHVLRVVAGILRQRLLDSGLTGGFVARVGGDEFVIVVQSDNRAAIAAFARALISEISQPIRIKGHDCRIGASIGVAITQEDVSSADELMMDADIALYRAKRLGRGRVEFFDKSLRQELTAANRLVDEILESIENRRFVPVYQPQFEAGSLALHGVEVLCRWQHPERGILPPAAFLAAAEELNVMADIDRLLCERVHADFLRLRASGVIVPRASFNAGLSRLLDPALIQQLSAIRALGVEVAVEFLESMSLDKIEGDIAQVLGTLRRQGILVEIDDFGSCRASIMGLMAVSPTAMKIDRQIVDPITRSEEARKMVTAIVEIGRAFGISVTAEGVETEDHIELATALGCTTLQGYALARPMPAEELGEFIADRHWAAVADRAATRPDVPLKAQRRVL